jgi:hypothetical protein
VGCAAAGGRGHRRVIDGASGIGRMQDDLAGDD